MTTQLDALRTSMERLREIVEPLDDLAITGPAYPTEWTIAQVMSHLGSGAVILQRRLEDVLGGTDTPEEFSPATWDEWNAKSPSAQVADGLAADASFLERLDAVGEDERRGFSFPMGPMSFDFDGFVGLRLNEHAFHTWDIEVALDPAAAIPDPVAGLVVDNLDLIARYTAKPVGLPGVITIKTHTPDRWFTIDVTSESVTFAPSSPSISADLELPAEAFARLLYGRLDPDHTPPFDGDDAILDRLRHVFPGP